MKDRFVKVMLVIIAGLLFLNCFKDGGSSRISDTFGTKVSATAPAFLEKGKSYNCFGDGSMNQERKVKTIDKDSGWIELDNGTWVNLSLQHRCTESK